MITRREFWKKTVGVATAAIAAISGKSVAKAGFQDGSTPVKIPKGKAVRFKSPSNKAPVDNNLHPLSSSAQSMWMQAGVIRCGKHTGPLMGVAVLYKAMLDCALSQGKTFDEYISDCEKKDFEESMQLRRKLSHRTEKFEDCRIFPPPEFMPFDGLTEAARGKKNGEEFHHKGIRWMRVYNDTLVPMSNTMKDALKTLHNKPR